MLNGKLYVLAGNQFSVPLIDFYDVHIAGLPRWESVLRPPDRLLA